MSKKAQATAQDLSTTTAANTKARKPVAIAPRDLSDHGHAMQDTLRTLDDATFEAFSDAMSDACGSQCKGKSRATRVDRACGNLARGLNKIDKGSVTNAYTIAGAILDSHKKSGADFAGLIAKVVTKVESGGAKVSGISSESLTSSDGSRFGL